MRPHSDFLLVALLSIGSISLAACGGAIGEPDSDATRTAAPAGGGTTPGASPGVSPGGGPSVAPEARPERPPSVPLAVDAAVLRVTLARVRLGAPSGCDSQYRSVDYERATQTMKWPGCAFAGGQTPSGPSQDYPTVERVLDDGEAMRVEKALQAITYTVNPPCGGYDGREHFMTTFGAGGEVKYSAYNINCYNYRAAPGIIDAYDVLESLRGP